MRTEQGPVCMKQIQIKFHTEVEDKTEILIKPTFFNIKNAFNKAKAQKAQTILQMSILLLIRGSH